MSRLIMTALCHQRSLGMRYDRSRTSHAKLSPLRCDAPTCFAIQTRDSDRRESCVQLAWASCFEGQSVEDPRDTSATRRTVLQTIELIRDQTSAAMTSTFACRLTIVLACFLNFADPFQLNTSRSAAGTTYVRSDAASNTVIGHSSALTSYVTPPSATFRSTPQTVKKLHSVSSSGKMKTHVLLQILMFA